MIEYEQQLTELINSDDESNWVLAVEIGLSLNDNDTNVLLYKLLCIKDSELHRLKWREIFNNTGLIPIGKTLANVIMTRLLEQVGRIIIDGRI